MVKYDPEKPGRVPHFRLRGERGRDRANGSRYGAKEGGGRRGKAIPAAFMVIMVMERPQEQTHRQTEGNGQEDALNLGTFWGH